MITTIAWIRSVRIDSLGLTAYVDIHSTLGPEITSKEFQGFDIEASADVLEAAILSSVQSFCVNELGIPVDTDHQVRLISKIR